MDYIVCFDDRIESYLPIKCINSYSKNGLKVYFEKIFEEDFVKEEVDLNFGIKIYSRDQKICALDVPRECFLEPSHPFDSPCYYDPRDNTIILKPNSFPYLDEEDMIVPARFVRNQTPIDVQCSADGKIFAIKISNANTLIE